MTTKTYVTFGQAHYHVIDGKVFDKDCVAVLSYGGRERAFELFGRKFCFEYEEQYWDGSDMKYFPRGYIEVD